MSGIAGMAIRIREKCSRRLIWPKPLDYRSFWIDVNLSNRNVFVQPGMIQNNTYRSSFIDRILAAAFLAINSICCPALAQPGTTNIISLEQQAEAGNVSAEIALGDIYHFGNGNKQDEKHAVQWWLKAAEQGNVAADTRLAGAYRLGKGVPKDLFAARAWENKAKEDGKHDIEVWRKRWGTKVLDSNGNLKVIQ